MPTTEFSIPNSRKEVFQQQVLGQLTPFPIIYRGVTPGNTPTELFIKGISGVSTDRNRVYVPEDAMLSFTFEALAINRTTGAAVYNASGRGAINNDGGTTALVGDADLVTAGTQNVLVGEHLDAGAAYAIAFTADDTNDALICTVTGAAATSVVWTVYVNIFPLSVRSLAPYGDS